MSCSLLGYSFKPRPNSRPLDTVSSVKTVYFVLKRMLSPKSSLILPMSHWSNHMTYGHYEKNGNSLRAFNEGKSRLSGPEVQATAASIKGFTRFGQSLIFSSPLKKTKGGSICRVLTDERSYKA